MSYVSTVIQPRTFSQHIYDSKYIPISIQTDIFRSNPDFYLCVSLEHHYIDKSSCIQGQTQLLLSGLNSGTFDLHISITQSDYFPISTSIVTIDIFRDDSNENDNQLYNHFMVEDQKYADSLVQHNSDDNSYSKYNRNDSSSITDCGNRYYANVLFDVYNTTSNQLNWQWLDTGQNTLMDPTDVTNNINDNNDNNNITNANRANNYTETQEFKNFSAANGHGNNYDDMRGDNIVFFFKDLASHSANDRFVYWACHQQSHDDDTRQYSSSHRHNRDFNRTSISRDDTSSGFTRTASKITHIITSDNSTTNSSIYTALKQCGMTVLYYPCLSSGLAESCFPYLQSYSYAVYNNSNKNIFNPTFSSSSDSPNVVTAIDTSEKFYADDKMASVCNSCFQDIITALKLTDTNVLIYMNTHGDIMTDMLLQLIRSQLPSITVGVDLPNIKLPQIWIDCCVDFIIAPSKYVALHSSVWRLWKPLLVIYPPLHPDFVQYASSLSYNNTNGDISNGDGNSSYDSNDSSSNNDYNSYDGCNSEGGNKTCDINTGSNIYGNENKSIDINSGTSTRSNISSMSILCNSSIDRVIISDKEDLQDKSPFIFIYVGRLSSEKSPGVLLRALALIVTNITSETDNTTNERSLQQDTSSSTNSSFLFSLTEQQRQLFRQKVRVNFYGNGSLKQSVIHLAQGFGLVTYTEDKNSQLVNDVNDSSSNIKTDTSNNNNNNNNRIDTDNLVNFYPTEYNRTKLATIMSAADCLINPRVMGETFGFIHIEAAAVGTPVIAFNRGANRETVSSGILLNEISVIVLAEAIYSMFNTSISNNNNNNNNNKKNNSNNNNNNININDTNASNRANFGDNNHSTYHAELTDNGHDQNICLDTTSLNCKNHLQKQSCNVVTGLSVNKHTANLFDGISIIVKQRRHQ